ncbi:hypothetical protein D3C87_1453420 [compost metagenome]
MQGVAADAVSAPPAKRRHRTRQCRHRALGGAVSQVIVTPGQGRDGRQVDDRTTAALHQRDAFATAQKHTVGIHPHHLLPRLQTGLFNRAGDQDAGIVDQDIQTPVALAHMVDDLAPRVFTADVVADKGCSRPDFSRQGLACLDVQVADQHLGPFGRQHPHAGSADPLGAAGDQRDFAVNPAVLVVLIERHHVISCAWVVSNCWPCGRATAAPARRPENTQSARDRPLMYKCEGMPRALRPAAYKPAMACPCWSSTAPLRSSTRKPPRVRAPRGNTGLVTEISQA